MGHYIAESAPYPNENEALPSKVFGNGRDGSPNCVIAHSAILSDSSSVSGSMDRHFRDNSSTGIQCNLCVDCKAALSGCAENSHLDSDSKGDVIRQGIQSAETDQREYSSTLNHANGDRDSRALLKPGSAVNRHPLVRSCTRSTSANDAAPIQPSASGVSNDDQKFDPSSYSFSSALRECQYSKLQAMRFDASKVSDSFSEYGLLKKSAVISSSNRFKDREQRTESMDVIADHEFNTREKVRCCYSPKMVLKESQMHRTLPGSTNCADQLTIPDHIRKVDLHRKHYDELSQDSTRLLRTFPSPGMSPGGAIQRCWNPANAYYNNLGHLAAENSIRTEPNMKQLVISSKSKWDDADKWLFSPSSGEVPTQGLPRNATYCIKDFNSGQSIKSKTGSAAAAFPTSPSAQILNGKKSGPCTDQGSEIIVMNNTNYNIKSESGFLQDRIFYHGDSKTSFNGRVNPAARPERMNLLSQDKYADILRGNSKYNLSSEKEFECDDLKQYVGLSMRDTTTQIAPPLSRTRDIGTQMSPPQSSRASPCTTPTKSSSPTRHNTPNRRSASGNDSTLNVFELQSCHFAKFELQSAESFTPKNINIIPNRISTERRDAGDDHFIKGSSKCTRSNLDIGNSKKNLTEASSVGREAIESIEYHARYKREAARITAWENHQKAKAETKLKKLEVKLEKLRADETEKIMKKLTAAEKKADDMRLAAAAHQAKHMARTPDNAAALIHTPGHANGTLTACFACRV